jgi:DNA-binding Lrp family transcriptional regulator
MDAKDVRIFCEMAFGTMSFSTVRDRQVSPSAIGKTVGLDEKTVRVRIKKMEEDGFIKHYQVAPSLSLLGLNSVGSYRFEALNLATKRRVVEYTDEIPHVLETLDYLGPFVSISFAGSSPAEVKKSADAVTSRFELSKWSLHEAALRNCSHRMDRTDWSIIKEMRYSARRSATDLARTLSITTRMAEYRIGRLLESGAMLVHASIDPRKQTGLVFYELELTVDEGGQGLVERLLAERHGERLWSTVRSSSVMIASMFGFSLGEPEDAAIDAAKFEGVKSCTLYVLKEAIEPRGPNWIDVQIEERLANA